MDEIQRLNQSIDWWNKWVIVGMAATAIAGSILVVAQLMVNKESRKLSETQDRLSKEKDDKLANDLRGKELLIAAANERASKLELDAATQRKLTAEANSRAMEAQLELARLKAPRVLKPEQMDSFIKGMSEFKGHRVALGAISTTVEAVSLGTQILVALKSAGVNVEAKPEAALHHIRVARGVVAKTTTGNEKGEKFALAFANALRDRNIVASAVGGLSEEAMSRLEKEGHTRNDTGFEWVVIGIGEKP